MRILVAVGTRPEAIKLAPVIVALRAIGVQTIICATGQHRDMVVPLLAQFDLTPDVLLSPPPDDGPLDARFAHLVGQLARQIRRCAPDRVLVQGDTLTALSGAMAAHWAKVPIDHVEAGLRSGDLDHPWPEEANRRMIAVVAHHHFAPTPAAQATLLAEGVRPDRVHCVGNTVIDALIDMRHRAICSADCGCPAGQAIKHAKGRRLVLATVHRRESHGPLLTLILQALLRLTERDDIYLVLPVHPHPAIRQPVTAMLGGCARAALLPPVDYPHFVRLLALAHLVLTDSGGIQEEAPAFGKPVLVLRRTTERPEGVAAGVAKLVGTDEEAIVTETCRLLDDPQAYAAMARACSPYGDGQSARRIAAILAAETPSIH